MVLVPFTSAGVVPEQDFFGQQIQGLGQAVSGAGVEMGRIADEEQHRRDVAKGNEIDALASDGDRNSLLPYLNQVGKGAVDGFAPLTPEFDARTQELEGKLETEVQRNAFKQRRLAQKQQFLNRAQSHYAQQLVVHEDAEQDAWNKSKTADAVAYFQGPDADHAARTKSVTSGARDLARQRGYGPEQTKQFVLEQETAIHAGVLDSLVDAGRVTEAKEYFEGHQDRMTPEAVSRARKAVRHATADAESAAVADKLDDEGGTLIEKLAALRGMNLDVEIRDNATARLKAAEATRRNQEAQARVTAYDQAVEWIGTTDMPYEMLPVVLKRAVEDAGVAGKVRAFAANHDKPATDLGMDAYLSLRANGAPLRGVSWERTYDAINDQLPDRLIAQVADFWAAANKAERPNYMASDRVDSILTQTLQDVELLPTDKPVNALQRTRHQRIELEVKTQLRDAFPGGLPDGQAGDAALRDIIKRVLSRQMTTPSGDKLPLAAMLPLEKAGAYIETSQGELIAKQEIEDAGSMEIQLAIDDIASQNRAIASRNASAPAGQPLEEPLARTPDQIAEAIGRVRQQRRATKEQAMQWLRQNKKASLEDVSVRGWEGLPDNLRERLEALGIEDEVQRAWAEWDASHDFLGRRIRPGGTARDITGGR